MTERLTFNTKEPRTSEHDGLHGWPMLVRRSNRTATGRRTPERRDWAFLFMIAFTALVFFRPQDAIPGLDATFTWPNCAPLGDLRRSSAGASPATSP